MLSHFNLAKVDRREKEGVEKGSRRVLPVLRLSAEKEEKSEKNAVKRWEVPEDVIGYESNVIGECPDDGGWSEIFRALNVRAHTGFRAGQLVGDHSRLFSEKAPRKLDFAHRWSQARGRSTFHYLRRRALARHTS